MKRASPQWRTLSYTMIRSQNISRKNKCMAQKKRKSIFFRILKPTSYGKGGVSFHISFLLYFFLQWYLKGFLPVVSIDQKLPWFVGKAALSSVLYIFPAFIKSRLSLKTRQLLIQGGNRKKSLCSITGWKKKETLTLFVRFCDGPRPCF